jgi:hypothetical protein
VERCLDGTVARAGQPQPQQQRHDLDRDEGRPRQKQRREQPFAHVEGGGEHPLGLRGDGQRLAIDAERDHACQDDQVAERAHALRDAGIAFDEIRAQQDNGERARPEIDHRHPGLGVQRVNRRSKATERRGEREER